MTTNRYLIIFGTLLFLGGGIVACVMIADALNAVETSLPAGDPVRATYPIGHALIPIAAAVIGLLLAAIGGIRRVRETQSE